MEWKVERSPTATTKMVEAPGDVQSLHLTTGGQGEGPMAGTMPADQHAEVRRQLLHNP